MDVRLQGERLVERGARWLIANRWAWRDTESAVALFQNGAGEVIRMFPDALRGLDRTVAEERREAWQEAGVPPAVAERAAVMEAGYAVLDVVEVATERGQPVADVCLVHFALADRLGIAHWMERINGLPRDERWGTLARATLREDLFAVHARLTANVIDVTAPGPTDDRLDIWWERSAPAVDDAVAALDEIATSATANLASLSVATRVLRSLLRALTGAHF
jgi:glutamate dehydrogenase